MRRFRRARTDYPDGVLAIYDNGDQTADRYLVIYTPLYYNHCANKPTFPNLSMSGAPYHPQGISLHGETVGYRITGGWGTGQKVIGFDDLPADCQRVVREDLAEVVAP